MGHRDRLVKVWRRLNFGFEEVRFEFGYLPHPRAVASLQWRRPFHPAQSTTENILYSFAVDGVARVWTTGVPEGHGHHGFGCQNLRLWGMLDLVGAIGDVPGQQRQQQQQGDKRVDDGLWWAFIISQRDLAHATERAIQERGGEAGQLQKDDVALQYLISIANRDTEICVVLDGRGTMSAWALENVSAKTTGKIGTNIDNVAFVRSKDFEFLAEPPSTQSSTTTTSQPPPHVEILNYCNRSAGNLHLLIHRFDDGTVDLFEGSIADLLDPTFVRTGRLEPRATWSGHSAAVKKIVRNFSGRAIVSRTQQGGESIVWKHAAPHHSQPHPHPQPHIPNNNNNNNAQNKQNARPRSRSSELLLSPKLIPERRHIHRIALIRGGSFVVFLHHESIAVWDCRAPVPTLMAEHPYNLPGKPLCILVLPRLNRDDVSVAHIATITSERRGVVWEVHLPLAKVPSNVHQDATIINSNTHQVNGHRHEMEEPPKTVILEEFSTFTLDDAAEDLAYVLPVDPAGAPAVVSSGFLDVFARDVAISYTHSGRVEFWTARIDPQRRRVEWLPTAAAETGVAEPALVSGSLAKKAALVNRDRSAVSIWDIRGARLEYYALEGRETEREGVAEGEGLDLDLDLAALDDQGRAATTAITATTTTITSSSTSTSTSTSAPVQDLDWTSTPDSQSILAVGYPYRVVLLSELRFDYLNRGPAWAPVRDINIRELTPHPIGDSAWLSGGHLVVGAGNQFFVYDRRFVAAGTPSSFHSRPRTQNRNRNRNRGGSGSFGKGKSSGGSGGSMRDLFDVVQRLNGPLPVFHPQFLSQCILAAKNDVVKRVLMALHRALKFHVEGDEIDDYLGLDLAGFYGGGVKVSLSSFFPLNLAI